MTKLAFTNVSISSSLSAYLPLPDVMEADDFLCGFQHRNYSKPHGSAPGLASTHPPYSDGARKYRQAVSNSVGGFTPQGQLPLVPPPSAETK